MRTCPVCSHELEETDRKCPYCDAPVHVPGASFTQDERAFFPLVGNIGDSGAEFRAAKKMGLRLCAVAGLSQHGKSEFMKSLADAMAREHGGTPPATAEIDLEDQSVKSTDIGTYYGWRIRVPDGMFLFWDIAGEDFNSLVRPEGAGAVWRPEPTMLQFVLDTLPQCEGILLCIALNKLWNPWNGSEPSGDGDQARGGSDNPKVERDNQTRLTRSKGTYVRYLELAHYAFVKQPETGSVPPPSSSDEIGKVVGEAVDRGRLLEVPVLVSFTMSDTYGNGNGILTPPTRTTRDLPRDSQVPSIRVYPERDDPHAVAAIFFPELLRHLETHVRWFKFDFSHAFQTGSTLSKPVLRESRGCLESFEFLMRMNWRSRWLSTKRILALRRLIFPAVRNQEAVRAILGRASTPPSWERG